MVFSKRFHDKNYEVHEHSSYFSIIKHGLGLISLMRIPKHLLQIRIRFSDTKYPILQHRAVKSQSPQNQALHPDPFKANSPNPTLQTKYSIPNTPYQKTSYPILQNKFRICPYLTQHSLAAKITSSFIESAKRAFKDISKLRHASSDQASFTGVVCVMVRFSERRKDSRLCRLRAWHQLAC